MSITLQVLQSPISITPSNANHIWNIRTSAYTLTDFQYIIDVYFRGSLPSWSAATTNNRAARLKVSPNEQGNAIVDLEEIVRTFLKSNVLFTGDTYPYLNYASDVNKVITLADGQTTRKYDQANLWAGGSPNTSLPQNWHISEYRIYIGYSYLSGSTLVENVDTNAAYQPQPITIFPGVDNKLVPEPFLSGASITHDGIALSANWFAQVNTNHLYYDLFRHKYIGGDDVECNPREFLNAAGRIYKVVSQGGFETLRARRRKHHPDCPIIISFLDGNNGYFNNQSQGIVVRGASGHTANYNSTALIPNSSVGTTPDDKFKLGVFYLPYNVTSGQTTNAIPTDSEKVCFYLTPNSSNTDFTNRTSEVLEFYMQERSCINTPIHVLFLNGRGMWDTYTFGGKSTDRLKVTRPSYRQEISLNKAYYNVGSWQRGTTIYEQEVEKFWDCETWYMDQNDVIVMEELFSSPEVYIIEPTTDKELDCIPTIETCNDCLEEIRLYQRLIPVVIDDVDFQVWNKNYEKLFQYKFSLQYAGQKLYRTQG